MNELPKTATHYAHGTTRVIYYRKKQIIIGNLLKRLPWVSWEFYDSYTGKWKKSFVPHLEIMEL